MESINAAIGINQNLDNTDIGQLEVISPVVKSKEIDQSKEFLLKHLDINIYDYFTQHVVPERESVRVMSINHPKMIKENEFLASRCLINVRQINDTRYINKLLNKVNSCLPDAGLFIGCIETVQQRKTHFFKKSRNIFKYLFWIYCFFFHRVMPKINHLQKLYFTLTGGNYRWLTKAEMLGRLVSCGFEVIEYKEVSGRLYFVVMKTHEPEHNMNPSFGPLFPMKRIGKDGKIIKVYKLRTMHPYSEYLQEFVVKMNGYNSVGKPANDFRLASWGKFFRKYWLDEVPQLLNVFKGNMAIVGMRPLSKTRFEELPKDVQEQRIKYKPGCIPPYVALNMPDNEQNIEAERIYMAAKQKAPFFTDIKFFAMAIYNILSGKIKSS